MLMVEISWFTIIPTFILRLENFHTFILTLVNFHTFILTLVNFHRLVGIRCFGGWSHLGKIGLV